MNLIKHMNKNQPPQNTNTNKNKNQGMNLDPQTWGIEPRPSDLFPRSPIYSVNEDYQIFNG